MVFHNQHSYSTTLTFLRGTRDISITSSYRLLHSSVRQVLCHSNHVCIIDFRLIGDTAHLWAVFVRFLFYDHSQPTSPGFIRLSFHYMTHAGVLKGVFQGVTPSFHSLGYTVLDCIYYQGDTFHASTSRTLVLNSLTSSFNFFLNFHFNKFIKLIFRNRNI